MKKLIFVVVLVFAVTSMAQTQTQLKSGSVEQELMRLEIQWSDALVKSDLAFLGQILADDWMGADQNGVVYSKAQQLALFKSGDDVISSLFSDDMQARVYGDAAVVTGRNTQKETLKGKDISGQYRWTDTFVKKAGRWQCVASHWSKIAQK